MKVIPVSVCKVPWCSTPVRGLGWCNRHYLQMHNYGVIKARTKKDPNEIEITDQGALIHLYDNDCNLVAKTSIDSEHVALAARYKWHLQGGYARNDEVGFLHTFVLGTKQMHDHINNDRLDNRKENLRPCTGSENAKNQKQPTNNTSGAKGVCWLWKRGFYIAQIGVNGRSRHIGVFHDLISAAIAYNIAALYYYGEFANLNDIEALKKELHSVEPLRIAYTS